MFVFLVFLKNCEVCVCLLLCVCVLMKGGKAEGQSDGEKKEKEKRGKHTVSVSVTKLTAAEWLTLLLWQPKDTLSSNVRFRRLVEGRLKGEKMYIYGNHRGKKRKGGVAGRSGNGHTPQASKTSVSKKKKKEKDINRSRSAATTPRSLCLSALQYESQRLLFNHCSGLLRVGVKLECPW